MSAREDYPRPSSGCPQWEAMCRELDAYRVLGSVDELQTLTAIGHAVKDAIVIDFGYSVRVRRIEGFGAGVTYVDIASATVLLNYLLAAGAVGSSVRDTPAENSAVPATEEQP